MDWFSQRSIIFNNEHNVFICIHKDCQKLITPTPKALFDHMKGLPHVRATPITSAAVSCAWKQLFPNPDRYGKFK